MSTLPPPPLIMVVDDQNSNLQLVGEVLDRAGYQVMPALSGEQAISRASLRRPELVLLDMAMPGMSGLETCQRLYEQHGRENLPIIFVTGVNDRNAMTTAFEVGAVDYITKPFIVDELLARVRTHLDLKRARDRLAAMVREREDVIDMVAHDLKNPLTCVVFAAESLRRSSGKVDRVKEVADEIESCADEALEYVQRFLTRGAAKQRLRQFGAELVDLREVAIEAARFQRSAAEIREQQIVIDGHASGWVDARALRNVIQNLLSNAIRHSPALSEIRVEVGVSDRAGYSRCAVRDQGTGIDEETQARLFKRNLGKADRPASDDPNHRYSTGLGLAIAKHDVAQMGGNLWYEPNEGGGSVFVIELPNAAPDGIDSAGDGDEPAG